MQFTLYDPNNGVSFTLDDSSYSYLSPYEILPTAPVNKYLRKISYFVMKLYVGYTH